MLCSAGRAEAAGPQVVMFCFLTLIYWQALTIFNDRRLHWHHRLQMLIGCGFTYICKILAIVGLFPHYHAYFLVACFLSLVSTVIDVLFGIIYHVFKLNSYEYRMHGILARAEKSAKRAFQVRIQCNKAD